MAQNGLIPVSLARHGHRYWRRFTSYDFARKLRDCSVVADEILPAAAAFPIVFKSFGQGIEPVALLSMSSEHSSPFVSDDGRWLACYVPFALRCFPFCSGPGLTETAKPRLFVDEASGLLTDDAQDEPFFVNEQLTKDLREAGSFLAAQHAARLGTQDLCKQIDRQDLFVELDHYEGIPVPDGSLTVDPQRLRCLPAPQVSDLMASGALRLIHAHHVSLSHCAWLSQAQRRVGAAPQQKLAPASAGLRAFFDAMATDSFQMIPGAEVCDATV